MAGDLSLAATALALTAAVVGALVQGSIGFGFALVLVPVLGLVRPDALPATVLFVATPMTILMAARERRAIDLGAVGYVTLGRLPGTVIGAVLLALATTDSLSILIGAAILLAVVLSVVAPEFEVTVPTHLIAGLISGVMATVASVGGPPLALAYQGFPGPELRSTLAAAFVLGTVTSAIGVAFAGRIEAWHFLLALQLVPGMLLGLALSKPLLPWLDRTWLRPAVLTFAGVSGAAAILTGLTS